ncbi:hypothetical protein Taro_027027 [Colocasia esculenta]|uniref:RING-type E3 ubiquitin transferase n=1 Tax=Colocasia esculenta TaxID=4460 RepID=A0A843VGV5_COLES|nr:hypothetical protein [Colocasia esculenta]
MIWIRRSVSRFLLLPGRVLSGSQDKLGRPRVVGHEEEEEKVNTGGRWIRGGAELRKGEARGDAPLYIKCPLRGGLHLCNRDPSLLARLFSSGVFVKACIFEFFGKKESILVRFGCGWGKMKFCKRYQEYMQGKEKELPGVGLKRLKKILKRCRRECHSQRHVLRQQGKGEETAGGMNEENSSLVVANSRCPDQCPVCDGTFFPALLNEMSAVVGCFNERARKLLELHLASGIRKYVFWLKGKLHRSHHETLIQQGKDLVTYAIINAIAMRKILKKYDKIHYSKQGQAFKSQAQVLHIEILQSPWLCELMALYINSRANESNTMTIPGLFEDCALVFDGDKPTLSCGLFDSLKLEVNLTCSICLDTVFDPVSLTCGHIFCYMCCCSAASVSIVDGLKSADPKARCPLCRQPGVYEGAVHLDELSILLRRSCPEYWEQRLRSERVERMRLVKEHWESQCRAFTGI